MNKLVAFFVFCAPFCVIAGLLALLIFIPLQREESRLTHEIELKSNQLAAFQNRLSNKNSESQSRTISASDLWNTGSSSNGLAEFQQAILEETEEAQLEIDRYEQISGQLIADVDTLGLRLELTGSARGLVEFLNALDRFNPRVAVRSLEIRPPATGQRIEGETRIFARLIVWGLQGDGT